MPSVFDLLAKKELTSQQFFPNRKLINFTVMPFKIQYALAHKLELTWVFGRTKIDGVLDVLLKPVFNQAINVPSQTRIVIIVQNMIIF